jgi:hypothetical protein
MMAGLTGQCSGAFNGTSMSSKWQMQKLRPRWSRSVITCKTDLFGLRLAGQITPTMIQAKDPHGRGPSQSGSTYSPMATNSKDINVASAHQSQASTSLVFLGADTQLSFWPRPNLSFTGDVEKLSVVHSPLSSPRSVSPPFSLDVQGSASSNSCTGCLTECDDPSCSDDLQITDQCTDRCVVVCDDTSHECRGDFPFEMCDDTSCDVPNDCVNCSFQDVNYVSRHYSRFEIYFLNFCFSYSVVRMLYRISCILDGP